MKVLAKSGLAILALLIIFSCKTGKTVVQQNTSDFTVRLEYSAGMLPDYKIIYLSADSCFYEARVQGQTQHSAFSCNRSELDGFQKLADDYHFYTMTSEDRGRVYDRGGTVLTMGPKNSTYTVSDSGSDFLLKQYQEDFRQLLARIYAFAAQKTGK